MPTLADVREDSPRVMIVSFDGMRPDAISKAHTPTLVSLIETGGSQLTAFRRVPAIFFDFAHSVPLPQQGAENGIARAVN